MNNSHLSRLYLTVLIELNASQLNLFIFFRPAANDRGYAKGRFARAKLSHYDKVNAGAKPPECTSASQ